jgi:hypothetical protein
MDEKNSSENQLCRKCLPPQAFTTFDDLLRHNRAYHRKRQVPVKNAAHAANNKKVKTLCENCGKWARHRSSECTKMKVLEATGGEADQAEDQQQNQNDPDDPDAQMTLVTNKYIPVHLAGTCPYCEYKFSDLLGHIRHGHGVEKSNPGTANTCPLCCERFGSVRELVSHRQLHPQFKQHTCSKCSLEFETVVEVRNHRAKHCTKSKKTKSKVIKSDPDPPMTSTSTSTASTSSQTISGALSTLMMMANNIDKPSCSSSDEQAKMNSKLKQVEYEGRGTVPCHICKKPFILKTLLRRHYINAHNFEPNLGENSELTGASAGSSVNKETAAQLVNKNHVADGHKEETCTECEKSFSTANERIKHQLEVHAVLSGQICPYCDAKWGSKKFDDLDSHVAKYHVLEMQSPVQTCATCKTNFNSYDALKVHRQIHEGGNRPRILVDVTSGEAGMEFSTYSVHPRVGAKPEISNRGGLKCQLCNMFKIRKDHLKLHYTRHHGYDPKALNVNSSMKKTPFLIDESSMASAAEPEENMLGCPSCNSFFDNNHLLIKHLLKNHCVYSGLICPYCRGHFPSRFIDLQSHVTTNHMEQLTGYNICNRYVSTVLKALTQQFVL